MNNDNDLLELYDNDQDAEGALDKNKEPFSINLLGVIMVLGFLVVIGMILFKNLSNEQVNREALLLRQVELLNILKTSQNQQEIHFAVNEYDSLARILEKIDNR